VTAADGAPEFYSLDNKARYESPDEALRLDRKLIEVWTGHPHHYIIENPKEGGFKEKMKLVNEGVFKIIGMPVAINYYKKFLLKKDKKGKFVFDDSIKYSTFDVEETILVNNDPDVIESKVRSRGVGDSHAYNHEVWYDQND